MKIIGAILAVLTVVYLISRFSNRCRNCGSWDTEYDEDTAGTARCRNCGK